MISALASLYLFAAQMVAILSCALVAFCVVAEFEEMAAPQPPPGVSTLMFSVFTFAQKVSATSADFLNILVMSSCFGDMFFVISDMSFVQVAVSPLPWSYVSNVSGSISNVSFGSCDMSVMLFGDWV